MNAITLYLGLDVDKDSLTIAIAQALLSRCLNRSRPIFGPVYAGKVLMIGILGPITGP